jgi:hypothetical protein
MDYSCQQCHLRYITAVTCGSQSLESRLCTWSFCYTKCFQMAACACSPCVIAACRTLTDWRHAQYQSWMEVESLHYSLPTGWTLSLQGKFYWCSETLTHKGSSHHSVMSFPRPFPQNPPVFPQAGCVASAQKTTISIVFPAQAHLPYQIQNEVNGHNANQSKSFMHHLCSCRL